MSFIQRLKRPFVKLSRKIRLLQLPQGPSWKSIGFGLEMEIDPKDYIDRDFFLGVYLPEFVSLLPKILAPGDVCIDAGAHKGYCTLLMAARVGPAGKVFSFEPDERTRHYLNANIQHNSLSHVTVFDCALGNKAGSMTFHVSSQPGWSSLFPNTLAQNKVQQSIEIPVRSLDELYSSGTMSYDRARLKFIKIDVEGAEPHVLEGLITTLREVQPVIWIEINESSLKAAGFTHKDVERILISHQYSLYLPHMHGLSNQRLALKSLDHLPVSDAAYDAIALIPSIHLKPLTEGGIDIQ
ncbi:MAG: FkbM family methyltransferase [bacterium]